RYTVRLRPPMEFPLTAPCPQCGSEMEPRSKPRRGRALYGFLVGGFLVGFHLEAALRAHVDRPAAPRLTAGFHLRTALGTGSCEREFHGRAQSYRVSGGDLLRTHRLPRRGPLTPGVRLTRGFLLRP